MSNIILIAIICKQLLLWNLLSKKKKEWQQQISPVCRKISISYLPGQLKHIPWKYPSWKCPSSICRASTAFLQRKVAGPLLGRIKLGLSKKLEGHLNVTKGSKATISFVLNLLKYSHRARLKLLSPKMGKDTTGPTGPGLDNEKIACRCWTWAASWARPKFDSVEKLELHEGRESRVSVNNS